MRRTAFTFVAEPFPRAGVALFLTLAVLAAVSLTRPTPASALGSASAGESRGAVAAAKLYWAEEGRTTIANAKVGRSNLDGSGAETVVAHPLLFNPRFLAVDVEGGQVYWTDVGTIKRATLAGGDVVSLAVSSPCPMGIAFHQAERRLYWTDCSLGTINRTNLDGSNFEALVTGLSDPRAIALDEASGTMYWTELGSKLIRRANLDGSAVTTLASGPAAPFLAGLALDLERGKAYWSDDFRIQRASLDGTGVETVLGGVSAGNLAVDAAHGRLYWTDLSSGSIRRASLDGSGAEDVVVGLDSPAGLALVPGDDISEAPPNDDFGSAKAISALPFSHSLPTRGATAADDDPSCAGRSATVWYALTPSADAWIEAGTANSSFDTTLSVYTGEPAPSPSSGATTTRAGHSRALTSSRGRERPTT